MTDIADTADAEAVEPEPVVDPGVVITLNGAEFAAKPGRMLIDACEDAGVYIPRFCYHPRMSPVGMCRMCLVEVDTGRGPSLQPSCMLTVGEGMVVETESDATKKAQDGVLELLLINHPLDCPVCDKGGECPLQDQTMSYGPGESRFVEEKRHFEKPIPISDIVFLDRERCILCDRCTRFAQEVAGDPLIHFMDRGNNTEVNTFPDEPFSSYFSGNTVQICPVGALTASPYRFKARPWDLTEVESTYPNAMGDRVTIQSSRNEVLRYLGVDSDAVNWGWLSDRDRFSFEATMNPHRLTTPLMRGDGLGNVSDDGGELVASTWSTALNRIVEAIEDARNDGGPGSVAVIGGARLTNEAQYAWARLAKGVIGTDNVDAQLGDGLPADIVAALPRATIDEVCAPGGTVVLVSGDPKEELGTLYLRLRHAALNDGVKIIELTPNRTGLSRYAAHSLRVRPGDVGMVADAIVKGRTDAAIGAVTAAELAAVAAAVDQAESLSVIAGRTSLADHRALSVEAINAFASLEKASFLPALRRGNVAGAIDLGLVPELLPGRTSLHAGRAWFTDKWGAVPETPGFDAAGILAAASTGRIAVLILLGADPLVDFPDPELAQAALARAGLVVATDLFVNASAAAAADIVLPAAAFGETAGSHTNLEGRITPLRQQVTPPGTARPDWMIAAEIAMRLGADMGFTSVTDITNEIAAVSGLHAGVDAATIEAATDGVVVPLSDAVDGFGYPARFEWTDLGEPLTPPPYDSYSYRLVIDRSLYDRGTQTSACKSLAGLAAPGSVRINPAEARRLGVTKGTVVRISSKRASVEGRIAIDEGVARGVAAVAHNREDLDVRSLVEMGELVTDVRIETL